jgi:LPS export ABC transporter protein LptC
LKTSSIKYCFVLFLISGMLLIYTSCKKKDINIIQYQINLAELPVETGKDIVFIYSDSGIVKAVLKTPLMKKFTNKEEPYIEMPQGVNVRFFDSRQNENGFLRADYGIQYMNRKTVEVKNNVLLVNTKGDTLNTEHLIWDERKNRIFSKKYVRVKTEKELIVGEGFESNPDFTKYEFKNIKGQISLNNSEE